MEKIILVNYIAVGNMPDHDVRGYMQKVVETLSPKGEGSEGMLNYFIPIRNGDSRVECLNPKLVSEEDFQKAKEVLDRNQKIVDDIVKWHEEYKVTPAIKAEPKPITKAERKELSKRLKIEL